MAVKTSDSRRSEGAMGMNDVEPFTGHGLHSQRSLLRRLERARHIAGLIAPLYGNPDSIVLVLTGQWVWHQRHRWDCVSHSQACRGDRI